jgi:hypothetical protein
VVNLGQNVVAVFQRRKQHEQIRGWCFFEVANQWWFETVVFADNSEAAEKIAYKEFNHKNGYRVGKVTRG